MIPSEARTPQLAIGADTPRPMKLRKASVKIASGMDKVRVTIIGPTQLGIIWRQRICHVDVPQERAAMTYSCCFRLRIWPRTMRAMLSQ